MSSNQIVLCEKISSYCRNDRYKCDAERGAVMQMYSDLICPLRKALETPSLNGVNKQRL
jgi:hypothetical protein